MTTTQATLSDPRLEGLEGLQNWSSIPALVLLLEAVDGGSAAAAEALEAVQDNRQDGDVCGWRAVLADWMEERAQEERAAAAAQVDLFSAGGEERPLVGPWTIPPHLADYALPGDIISTRIPLGGGRTWDFPGPTVYRAAVQEGDEDGRGQVVLTGPEHAHLTDEELEAEGRLELARAGLPTTVEIAVMEWTS